MSTRSVQAVHSAGHMIIAQLVIGFGQLLYSAATARVFAPSQFGAFAAILSLQGLVTLVTTTGLPSFALKEQILGRAHLRSLTILALLGSAISTVGFLVLAPAWLDILNAPGGSVFIPLMALTVFVSPFSSVQSALLRRESRSALDRRMMLAAFVLSNGSGLILILMTHDLWSLAWATFMNPMIVLILSSIFRKTVVGNIAPSSMRNILQFSTKVTFQNLVFFVMYQMPGWAIGAILGPGPMGSFSRATTLTSLPSAAMSSGLSRVLQPLWRHVDGAAAYLRAATEATVISALFSFPMFGILAATGPELARLWLGPGWEVAYNLTPLLAIAYGLQVPYVALAGSCEMRGRFLPGRISQIGMILSLVVFLGMMIVVGDVIWAGIALVAAQLIGLSILSIVATKSFSSHRRILVGGLTRQMISGVAVGTSSWGMVRLIEYVGGDDTVTLIFAVVSGSMVGACVFILLLRWNASLAVLQDRGIKLPKWFSRGVA